MFNVVDRYFRFLTKTDTNLNKEQKVFGLKCLNLLSNKMFLNYITPKEHCPCSDLDRD